MLPPSLTRIVLYCSAISVNYSVGCFNILANILVHTTIANYDMSVCPNLIICPSGVFTKKINDGCPSIESRLQTIFL